MLTMNEISYGISKPRDLFDKLVVEGNKINENPHPYDLFNFFVTAAVLNEWVRKYYSQHLVIKSLEDALHNKNSEKLPIETIAWITDKTCLPNRFGERMHVYNALKICWDIANASKHYHYLAKTDVSAIEDDPVIKDYYQYCFTSKQPGIYIEYAKQYYNVLQIKQILNQFYSGLLSHIEGQHLEN